MVRRTKTGPRSYLGTACNSGKIKGCPVSVLILSLCLFCGPRRCVLFLSCGPRVLSCFCPVGRSAAFFQTKKYTFFDMFFFVRHVYFFWSPIQTDPFKIRYLQFCQCARRERLFSPKMFHKLCSRPTSIIFYRPQTVSQ